MIIHGDAKAKSTWSNVWLQMSHNATAQKAHDDTDFNMLNVMSWKQFGMKKYFTKKNSMLT